MFDFVIQGSPRTNNAVEGWHRAINSALAANHVTVCKFINILNREQGLQEAKIEQQTDLNERLNTVVKGYDETNKYKYLKSIAHNLVL